MATCSHDAGGWRVGWEPLLRSCSKAEFGPARRSNHWFHPFRTKYPKWRSVWIHQVISGLYQVSWGKHFTIFHRWSRWFGRPMLTQWTRGAQGPIWALWGQADQGLGYQRTLSQHLIRAPWSSNREHDEKMKNASKFDFLGDKLINKVSNLFFGHPTLTPTYFHLDIWKILRMDVCRGSKLESRPLADSDAQCQRHKEDWLWNFWPSSIYALFERFPEIVAPGTASRFSQWHGLAMVGEPSPKMAREWFASAWHPQSVPVVGRTLASSSDDATIRRGFGSGIWMTLAGQNDMESGNCQFPQEYSFLFGTALSRNFKEIHIIWKIPLQSAPLRPLLWWFWLWLSILELYAAMVDSWES